MADTKISALTASTTPLAGTEVLPIVQSSTTKQVSVANLTAGRAIACTDLTASGELISTTNNARISLYRAAGTNYFDWASGQPLAFGTQTSQGGAGRTNKVNFTDAGNIEVVTGNLVIGTAGKGIDFSATSHPAGMTSELLADYEEGVSTVTLAFGGGSTGIVYSSQECRYTRIGNRIMIQIGLAISNKGSSTGAATISGLPFTSKNVGYGGVVMTAYADNFTGLGAIIIPFLGENSSTISLRTTDLSSNTTVNVTDSIFNNTSYLMISGSYLVA